MRSRHVLISSAAAAAALVLTVGALPAAADEKRGDAARCPTGRQHVISSTTTGSTTHRDVTRANTWEKGSGTNFTSSSRTGSEAAYTWRITAKQITTGGTSCSIL